MSELEAHLAALGAPSMVRAKLAAYGELLLARTAVVNVTAARTPQAVAAQIADALPLAPLITGPLVDIGSGGGLPAIPIAILCGTPVVLVEAIAKKATFLRDALADLGLEGLVLQTRAESVGREAEYRGQFAHATARAVGSITTVAELAVPLLAIGGTALLQRGAVSSDERDALKDAALMLGAEIEPHEVIDGERRIIVLRKTAATQARFPRRAGIPAKRPLCVT